MTDGSAGWFKDPSDSSLARWHDGNDWTEHTLVIADQVPGVEPLPPATATPEPSHVARHGRSVDLDDGGSRLQALPWWVKVGAPVLVLALAVLAFSLVSGGDDADDRTETVDTLAAALDDAVDAARRSGLPTSITDSQAGRLIERICEAARRPATADALGEDLGELPVLSAGELRSSIDALGDGARTMCAEDLRDEPDLIGDLQSAAVAAFTTTTTAPTIVPEGTDAGVDGGVVDPDATTTTKKKGTTTTTKKPTTASSTTTTGPTTTTLPVAQNGFPCPSEGARAVTGGGTPLTCSKPCYGVPGELRWRSGGPCPTTTPPPSG